MAVKAADVFINLIVDKSGLKRAFDEAEGETRKFSDVVEGFLNRIGHRAFDAIINGARNVVGTMADAVAASSDLSESINKTSVVFGRNAQAMLDWSETSATAFGQSRQQALEAASGLGNLFVSMGSTQDAAADMSREIVELAGDLASFNNLSPDEVLTKLRAGLVGETEPLRTLGVNLSAVAVEAKAMELGLAASSKALTEQDKILARYQLILDQTALAQGDFARTSDGAANAQRILTAQLADASASLGNIFRPAYEAILNLLVDLAPTVFSYAENIASSFANGLAQIIRYITPVLLTVRSLLAYWLAPGSPPRLLPDLVEWGLGAMQAYMEGFTLVDVRGALSGIGRAIEGVLRSFVSAGRLGQNDLVSRILGGRDAIARAVREFRDLGRVSSETMADIVRAAGPAGAAVAGLVRSYFDLQRASQAAAKAQDELNQITAQYQKTIDPLAGQLSANQGAQQAIRDELRLAQLRADIADAALDQEQALAAQREISEIRERQAAGTGTWSDRIQDQERLLELEKRLADSANAAQNSELARLEIEEIRLRQQLDGVESERDAVTDLAQQKLDQARAAEQAAQAQLDAAQAFIDIQAEHNRLIGEQIELNERLERERIQSLDRIAAEEERLQREREKAARDEQNEAEKLQRDQEAVADAQFAYQFATADTAGKLALLQQALSETDQGTVDYYRTLTQIFQVQQQLNRELEKGTTSQEEATDEAERAAQAQFAYQFSIADTAGKLQLLQQQLAGTSEGTAEYYQTLTQIAALEKQYQAEIERATDAQFQYQLALADTPEKIALLQQALAETTVGSTEYYQMLTQISQLERQYQNQLDSEARQSAAEAERERAKAIRESEQALRELEATQKRAAAEAEAIADAQFRYQLAIADTPGKIELVRAKLAQTKEGTVEYYNLLTQLNSLEVQLNKEREAAAKALEKLGAVNLGPSFDANITAPQLEASEAGQNLRDAIEGFTEALKAPPTPMPANLKAVADSAKNLMDQIGLTIEALGRLIGFDLTKFRQTNTDATVQSGLDWINYRQTVEQEARLAAAEAEQSASDTKRTFDTLAENFAAITALMNGDWQEFWRIFNKQVEDNREPSKSLWNGLLGDILIQFAQWWQEMLTAQIHWIGESIRWWGDLFRQIGDAVSSGAASTVASWSGMLQSLVSAVGTIGMQLRNAGSSLLNNLWSGISDNWENRIMGPWRRRLEQLANLLPFSEPKDPTSPLRGLAKSGESMVDIIQGGIEKASFNIDSLASSLLSQPAGLATAAPTTGGLTFNVSVVIEGNADEDAVRRGVAAGSNDIVGKLRQMGIS